ncbi:hypothetical protein TsFJ059_007896 [Trichoderma semiorbis]|uniref:Uncharacterized protein n=1 Tax=Trichoderma semiorbis TaxID=1491008 RepID=A0A9P8KT44_9HYPO|nr:hypothetical protein TsFJ059_007896 [Trichoderma semiorbis]
MEGREKDSFRSPSFSSRVSQAGGWTSTLEPPIYTFFSMENQTPQDGLPSRDSSISLEDGIALSPRSDLYITRHPRREAYGPVTSGRALMIPLDLPNVDAAEDPSAGTQPSDESDSSLLLGRRLGRYLAEEHNHERVPLGLHPLGVNKATVKRYLPDIMQGVDNDASQAEATQGATTDCEEGECRGSTTTLASTTSGSSPDPIKAHNNNDAATVLLPLITSFSSYDMIPRFLEPDETDTALVKPKQGQTSSEFHLLGSDICEEDLEVGQILMQHRRMKHQENHDKWRVGKHKRVRKTIRLRKRPEELK